CPAAEVATAVPTERSEVNAGSSATVHNTATSGAPDAASTRVQIVEPSGAGSPAMTPSTNGTGSGTPGGGVGGSTSGVGTQLPSSATPPAPRPSAINASRRDMPAPSTLETARQPTILLPRSR